MREFERIDAIRKLAGHGAKPGRISLGIGDDCCLLECRGGEELALSTDTLVEDVHFRLTYYSFRQVGIKAAAAAISDLAAMGAAPAAMVAAVSAPESAEAANLDELAAGLEECGRVHGCPLAGGDLTRSTGPLVVTVTVAGIVPRGGALLRSAAREGDELWLTGTPGDAAALLALLEDHGGDAAGLGASEQAMLSRLLEPRARVREGELLRSLGMARAAIDISDGVAADLGHILEESGTGAIVYEDSLPVSEFSASTARGRGLAPAHFLLHGGEDFELLFTARPGAVEEHRKEFDERSGGAQLTMIGRITGNAGQALLESAEGERRSLETKGYEHFT